MEVIKIVLTYRDYAALPDDGRRYEIHEGELSITLTPSPWHQLVSGSLMVALHTHVNARGLGEIFPPLDVILSDTTIVQPDIVFVAIDRLGRISERGIEGAPTLVIEILLPRTRQIDRYVKTRLYARHGIPYYWMVDSDAHGVECYTLSASGYTLSAWLTGDQTLNAAPFPDLELPLASLWA